MGTPIEFLLKLEAQVDGAVKMEQAVTKAEESLHKTDTALDKTEKATRHAGEGHKKHAKDAEHLEGALHRLVHSGMEPFLERAKTIAEFEFIRKGVDAILEAPGELIEKVKELGEEIIKTAADAQALQMSFGLSFGKEAGSEAYEWADKFAAKTDYTADQIRGVTLELGKAGLKGQALEDALRASADIGAMSKDRVAGLEGAASAISRMAITGMVSARTLVGIGVGINDFRKLPEYAHITRKEFTKMMTDGKVTGDQLYKLITVHTGRGLGGAAADLGEGLHAALKNVGELPEKYFERFAKSPVMGMLTDKLREMFDQLDPDSPRGQRIFGSMERAFTGLIHSVGDIDIERLANVIETRVFPAIEKIATRIGAIDWAAGANALLDILENIKPIIDDIATVFDGIAVTMRALGVIGPKGPTEDDVAAATAEAGKDLPANLQPGNVQANIDQIFKMIHAVQAAGGDAGLGLAKGIEKSTPKPIAATTDMVTKSVGAARSALDAHSPSRVMMEIGEYASDGYAIGILRGQASVRSAIAEVVTPPAAAAAAAAGGGRSAGVTVGDLHVHVSVEGGSHASGEEIAERIKEVVPSAIAEIFEKLGLQLGAAA